MGKLADCNVLHVQAHYATILRLKQYFPFSLIDAMGGLEDTRAQISRELRYQSSLDLDEATYAAIRHLPLAQDLVRASRQQLVHRLDTYSKRHHKIFMEVRHKDAPCISTAPTLLCLQLAPLTSCIGDAKCSVYWATLSCTLVETGTVLCYCRRQALACTPIWYILDLDFFST